MTVHPAARPENEFAALTDIAARLGVSAPAPATVQRRWFTASLGGHVSAVIWGDRPPSAVVLPDDSTGARSLDELALLLGEPIVIVDRPGTGRSSGPAVSAARSGRVLAEAVFSFAARTETLIGVGPGGSAAALATAARATTIRRVLVSTAGPSEADPIDLLAERGVDVVHLAIDGADVAATAAALLAVLGHVHQDASP